MAKSPSGRFSFEALNREIREYLAGLSDEKSATRALRRIRAAEAKVRKITKSITRASLARAAEDGFEIRNGIVREPAPEDGGPPSTEPLLSESDDERRQARDVQAKLLPAEVPDCPGIDIATFSRFSRDVGGDYFDFLRLSGGRLGVVIADVSGKGVPAAMVMVMFRSIFRMVAANRHTPAETVVHTNRLLARDLLRGMFVSALYAVIDPASRAMTLVNAGHLPPLIWRRRLSGTRAINIRGPAVGLLGAKRFEEDIREKTLVLETGDCLCLYTDGVTDAKNLLGEEFGSRALARALRASADQPAEKTINELVDAVDTHQADAPQHDDITLIVLRAT